ncbi:MAG: head-tail connector protein [Clostridia bacterium]|nr:head-tail connector protein [Clostridia bacterium]
MILSLDEAREILRIDGTDNDNIITSLVEAIPDYITLTTGIKPEEMSGIPLVKTVAKFILQFWYNAEQSDGDRLQRTIDSLLKTLSLMASRSV